MVKGGGGMGPRHGETTGLSATAGFSMLKSSCESCYVMLDCDALDAALAEASL